MSGRVATRQPALARRWSAEAFSEGGGPAPRSSCASARPLQLRVHLSDEPIAGHPNFLHLWIEIGRDFGGNYLVFAFALSQQTRHAIANGQRNVAVRDNGGAIDGRSVS